MLSEFEIGELVPGTSYRVISCIGQGGMGSVYEVEHRELGKRFVVKALLREFVGREDLVQRLRNEWRALGSLEHPHIVSVSDAGVSTTGVPYYVMERLHGETLAERIKRLGRLELDESFRVAIEVLDALSAAHAIGVVHRDIKPPNIFLTRNGASKVLDFGIAKLLDGNAGLTGRGVAIGTPRYMSPEQASGERVDARADLYAVGLLLFEMLSGQSPFEGATAQDVFLAHVVKPAPSILSLVPDAPKDLAVLIARLLEKRPADRVRSAKRAAEVLRLIQRRQGLAGPDPADTDVSPLSGALPTDIGGAANMAGPASNRGPASSRMPPSLDPWTISENGPTLGARQSAPPGARQSSPPRSDASGVPTELLTHSDSVSPTRTLVPAITPVGVAPSPAPWGLTPLPQFRGYSASTRNMLRWGAAAVLVVISTLFLRSTRFSTTGLVAAGAREGASSDANGSPNSASPNGGVLSPGAAPPGSAAMPGSNASPNSGQAQAAAAAASGQGGVAPGTAPSSAGASGSSLPGSVPTSHAQPGTSAPAEGAPSSSLRSDGAIGSAEKAKLEAESPIAQDATEPGEESERKPKGAAPPRSARSEADVPADRRLPSSGL